MPTTEISAATSPSIDVSTVDAVALDRLADQLLLLRQTREKIASFQKVAASLRRKIEDELGVAEIGTIDGRPVVTWKRTLRVAVSQRKLKELFPEVLPQVQDISEVRTFKVLDQ